MTTQFDEHPDPELIDITVVPAGIYPLPLKLTESETISPTVRVLAEGMELMT
jgi:hypothetical protein